MSEVYTEDKVKSKVNGQGVEDQENIEKEDDTWKDGLLALFFIFFGLIGLIASAIWIYEFSFREEKYYTDKVYLEEKLSSAIHHNADLGVLKTIYKNRPKHEKGLFSWWNDTDKIEYIEYPIPFSKLLEDLLAEQYLKKQLDTQFVAQIEVKIKEYNTTDPFDRLDKNQSDLLKNIAAKLGQDYEKVSVDLLKVSEEWNKQNEAIDSYLGKSDQSYWMSIIALVLTIIFSAVQIYQGYYYHQIQKDDKYRQLVREIFNAGRRKKQNR